MTFKNSIIADTPVWRGVTEYAQSRIADLTATCIAADSLDADIRRAQAGILELQRLLALPDIIKSEGQHMALKTSRREY